jgi:hypothetical protein
MKGIHVIQRRKRKRKLSPSLTLIPKHDPTK